MVHGDGGGGCDSLGVLLLDPYHHGRENPLRRYCLVTTIVSVWQVFALGGEADLYPDTNYDDMTLVSASGAARRAICRLKLNVSSLPSPMYHHLFLNEADPAEWTYRRTATDGGEPYGPRYGLPCSI